MPFMVGGDEATREEVDPKVEDVQGSNPLEEGSPHDPLYPFQKFINKFEQVGLVQTESAGETEGGDLLTNRGIELRYHESPVLTMHVSERKVISADHSGKYHQIHLCSVFHPAIGLVISSGVTIDEDGSVSSVPEEIPLGHALCGKVANIIRSIDTINLNATGSNHAIRFGGNNYSRLILRPMDEQKAIEQLKGAGISDVSKPYGGVILELGGQEVELVAEGPGKISRARLSFTCIIDACYLGFKIHKLTSRVSGPIELRVLNGDHPETV